MKKIEIYAFNSVLAKMQLESTIGSSLLDIKSEDLGSIWFSFTNGTATASISMNHATGDFNINNAGGDISLNPAGDLQINGTNGVSGYGFTKGIMTDTNALVSMVTNQIATTTGVGGLFSMVGGVTNQTVSYGVTYPQDMWPVITPTADATFQVTPEIVSYRTSNFVFRLRGAAGFVTNGWDVIWNANPTR